MTLSKQQLEFDSQHIWHPYTNLKRPTPVFGVESAQGVHIHLSNGRKLVDGMASWWSVIHGYNHPDLNLAIENQLKKMSHVMFGGLTHEPAIELAKRLVNITHDNLSKVFFSDSGSVAVEVSIKMALQYWYAKGQSSKNRFLTLNGGYHGDTFGAMSVCDPVNGMHNMFRGVLPQHLFADITYCQSDDDWQEHYIDPFRELLESNHESLAAVIIEPLVQGAGGMRFYCPEYLRQIKRLCEDYDVLLILDEIATGFGRAGTLFAYEQAGISPDILCLGKALTGGYMSLAATMTSTEVADTISDYSGGNLMHGPTFMANPLACAAANKSIGLLLNSDWLLSVQNIERQLKQQLEPCRAMSAIADVRVKGAIGVLEFKEVLDIHQVQPRLVELGVWIRPFSSRLYIMPPYIINPAELSLLTQAMTTIAEELSAK